PVGEHLGGDHVGEPVPGGVVGQVHQVGVEAALVQGIGPAGAVGDQVAVLGGLGEQVARRRVLLVGGVDQERVRVGGDGDALGVQVGDQVGPSGIAVGVQLPGPPQPVAEGGGALAGPVLQP